MNLRDNPHNEPAETPLQRARRRFGKAFPEQKPHCPACELRAWLPELKGTALWSRLAKHKQKGGSK